MAIVMDSLPFFLWLMISLTLNTTLLPSPISSTFAHSIKHHHNRGPITNATKHLYFSVFNPNKNPSINQDIKLLGNANFSNHHMAGFIQIPDSSTTVDLAYKAGRAIYSSPIRLLDPFTQTPASFHTTFSFQLNTTTTAATGGSGLAFIIVSDEFTIGRPGPWLGILNDACDHHYKVFAVEFDTGHDSEFRDPNDNHVGIDLGSIISFKTANVSQVGVSLNDGSVHRAWITYDGHRKWLDVHLGSDTGAFPSKPILSVPLKLSPYLHEYMFVGFSASTGKTAQTHNILSWNFSSTVQANLLVPSARTCKINVHKDSPSSFMIFVAIMGLLTVTLVNLYYNGKHRKSSVLGTILPEKKTRPLPPTKARRYTMCEVYRATRSFSEVSVLGSDSNGVLYRGTLFNGCHVAVKRFTTRFFESVGLDRRRVVKLVEVMSRVCHPSLAPIRGWCCDDKQMIVVYHYFHNGSLDRWLLGLGALPWTRRFELIKEVAGALSYLHSKGLVHGNLRNSSVFIDMNYRAVLSDYGFVVAPEKPGDRVDSVAGQKADVYGFGMLALEIVAGKKSVAPDSGGGGEDRSLLGQARRLHERGETHDLYDRRIGCCVNSEEATRVLDIALVCTLSERNDRPSMEEVVQFLHTQNPIPQLIGLR
ncbi:probable L-type lectin-domain containing receptor kinase S.7 [Cornus florida]|uniref:probable L-type lectin-domain containing receptor kinase S.7 n=1 Tax=Cornus florida TaxID=4283 RepID=UPI00289FFCAA|nr:probable L-type lectin-domain containing receptor kinase S.7 [Cornus florida]